MNGPGYFRRGGGSGERRHISPWSFRSSSAGRDDGGGLPTRRYGGVAGPQSDLPILPSYYEVVWIIRVK